MEGTPIEYLAELSSREFNEYQHLIDDEVVLRRARHVVYENERVLQAVDALKAGELEVFGELMNAFPRAASRTCISTDTSWNYNLSKFT